MTSAMEYFCKNMCNSCVCALSRNPIKVVNLPHPPNGRNPDPPLYQITALHQRKGTWGVLYNLPNLRTERSAGEEPFSFFDVFKQLFSLLGN